MPAGRSLSNRWRRDLPAYRILRRAPARLRWERNASAHCRRPTGTRFGSAIVKRLFGPYLGVVFMLVATGSAFAKATTTTTLAVSTAPVTFGTVTSMVATVVGSSPTGVVSFYDNSTFVGTAQLSTNGSG